MLSSNTGYLGGHTLRSPITSEHLPSEDDAITTEGLTLRNTTNHFARASTSISAQGAVEPGVQGRITPTNGPSQTLDIQGQAGAKKRKWDIIKEKAATVMSPKRHREDSESHQM